MHSPAPPSRRDVIEDVTATTAVQTLVALSALTAPAIAPAMAESLGIKAALVGFMVSTVYGAAMLTSLQGGVLVRKYGAGRMSQMACLFSALGLLTIATAWLPAVALGAFLMGLGYGLPNPAAAHLFAKSGLTRRRNLIFSIKQTGVPLGGVIAGLLAPPIATHAGWPWAMAAFAGVALLLAALLQLKRAAWDDDRDPSIRFQGNPFVGLGQVWRSPPLRWLSLAGFCLATVQLCLTTFLVTMLVEEVGYSLIAAGGVLAAVQVAGVAGRILWGLVADRLQDGLLTLLVIGGLMLVGTVGTALLTPHWPLAAVYGVLLLFGISAVAWNGVYLAEVARLSPPGQASRSTGASLFFTYGGVLFGPTSFALVHGLVRDYGTTFALLTVAGLLALLFTHLARRMPHP